MEKKMIVWDQQAQSPTIHYSNPKPSEWIIVWICWLAGAELTKFPCWTELGWRPALSL